MCNEYAKAGVDPSKIKPFKEIMKEVGKRTILFPMVHDVIVFSADHGAAHQYIGNKPHIWVSTNEGLGNKNWIAEWMAKYAKTGRTYYEGIGIDVTMMSVNDAAAHGGNPCVYLDEVSAGNSEWFENEQRSRDLAEGYYRACEMVGMALPAGESASLRYLVKSEWPVDSAPVLSGCVISLVAPASRYIDGKKLRPGDRIIVVTSSGMHSNGSSLIIRRALSLPLAFLEKLPNGNTLGDEALIPTRCYVGLVNALLSAEVDVHAFLPGTGDGIAKLVADKRSFTYRIHDWVEVPPICQYVREQLHVPIAECLNTFNWGGGYYVFVPAQEVNRTIDIGTAAGYELKEVGAIEEGERKVIFGPEGDLGLYPKE